MKKRESNIELLRIVCIMGVIMNHYAFHTAWIGLKGINLNIIRVLGMGGRLGINIFLLIAGYFGITSATDTRKKIIKLWKERWLYSMFISAIMVFLGYQILNLDYVLKAVFPIITCRHNYVTTFIMLYVFIPYINKGINALSQEEMKKMLLIWTVIISVIPTILTLRQGLYSNNVYSYLMWMAYMYCVGAYIRKYGLGEKISYGLLSLVMMVVMIVMAVYVEPNSDVIPNGYNGNTPQSFLLLLTSVFVFCFFANAKVKYNKVINWFASSTFAILLIHDDPIVRQVLWNKWLNCASHSQSNKFIIWTIMIALFVYVSCVIIDKVVKLLIHCLKRMMRFVYEKN